MQGIEVVLYKTDKTLVLQTNRAKTVVRCADIQRNVGVRGRKTA